MDTVSHAEMVMFREEERTDREADTRKATPEGSLLVTHERPGESASTGAFLVMRADDDRCRLVEVGGEADGAEYVFACDDPIVAVLTRRR